jgi:MSHA biogenesis protein MshK
MAEYLTMTAHAPYQKFLILCIGMANLLLAYSVKAEPLIDPTQPPASLFEAANGTAAADFTGPVLQSVLIGPHYRAAIISGEKVMLGQKYGQSTLIQLNEREAVLRHADRSTQTLALHPIIVKKVMTSTTAPVKTKRSMPFKSTPKYTK